MATESTLSPQNTEPNEAELSARFLKFFTCNGTKNLEEALASNMPEPVPYEAKTDYPMAGWSTENPEMHAGR